MKILALDLSTMTGWATNIHGRRESGTQNFQLRRGESPGMRFVRFNSWLSQWAPDGWRPELIVYEQAHHRGGAATEVAVGLVTRVLEFCALHGIEHMSVHSATLKKFFTGSGRAAKGDMLVAAMKKGYRLAPCADDNEVDAIALFDYAQQEIRTPNDLGAHR